MWDSQEPLTILEFGVGKGGDLGKWSKHGIKHLIGFDIAAESLACCKSRYDDMQRNTRRFQGSSFTAEFYEADFTRVCSGFFFSFSAV
jgi:ubiquinone/menaquinone biosynthesis C-methylase UbiE